MSRKYCTVDKKRKRDDLSVYVTDTPKQEELPASKTTIFVVF